MDPKKHDDAVFLPELSFAEVLEKQYRVMDLTAFALCRENDLPIVVFNMDDPDAVVQAARGDKVGTRISN